MGESYESFVNYTVQGVNKTGMTSDFMGTLSAIITMTTNGLVTNCGASFDTYGTSTNQNSAFPDLGSYGQSLAGNASAGGAGNSVPWTTRKHQDLWHQLVRHFCAESWRQRCNGQRRKHVA